MTGTNMRLSSCTIGRALLLILFLLAPFLIQVPNVGALPETVVQIEPYVTTEEVAESFTINVTLSDVQNLYGVKVIIRWNSDILQVVNVDVRLGVESHSDGVLHEDIFVVKNESRNDIGKYRLEAASYDKGGQTPPPSFNGSGNIVRLTFYVTDLEGCPLDLESELYDKPRPGEVSQPIEHTRIPGFFDPTPPIIGIPTRIPSEDVSPEDTVKVFVNVTDLVSGVKNVTLLYSVNNESTWQYRPMNYTSSTGLYEATIPPQPNGTWVKYKIVAFDYAENRALRDGTDPLFIYQVIPEIPQTMILPLLLLLTVIAVALVRKVWPKNRRAGLKLSGRDQKNTFNRREL